MSSIYDILVEKMQKGGEISPFLFLASNLELLHSDIEISLKQICSTFLFDAQSIFFLRDSGESLKIETIKTFLRQAEVRPRFAFQIFVIEHISRMTSQSQNACLKFFEEPGEWNIVILSNPSESGILETILSRIQTITFGSQKTFEKNAFFFSLIESHIAKKSPELIQYFFSAKLEKQEYGDFLRTLLLYIIETGNYLDLIDELQEDITGVLKNNLQGRYIVDKYIIKI